MKSANPNINEYVVAIEPEKAELAGVIKKNVFSRLSVFFDKDEAESIYLGTLKTDDNKSIYGVVFNATAKAAETIAEAYPTAEITSSEGNLVMAKKPPASRLG